MNTPKHVALFEALGIDPPVYAHMPLIFNVDGSKMSKRDKDKTAKALGVCLKTLYNRLNRYRREDTVWH